MSCGSPRISFCFIKPIFLPSRKFPVSPTRLRGRQPAMRAHVTTTASPPLKRSCHAYAIAPMMDVTDRHFRALVRLISRHATLYTEMVVDRSIIHNATLRELSLTIPKAPTQHPVVLQLGGSVPDELEAAARIAAQYGYTEINLNCGCPSPKVAGKGCFGAALMRTPEVVAEATRRMKAVLPRDIPVTVKCRIGVDDEDSYEGLSNFVRVVHEVGGVDHFIIHARKAILGGLSPAQNRSIPPLKYEYVYRLVEEFPQLRFSINGGLKTVPDVLEQLERGLYGVMIGRSVMDQPWHALCDVDNLIFGVPNFDEAGMAVTRRTVIRQYLEYAEEDIALHGGSVRVVVKPLLNLFHGEPKGKKFRRAIDEGLRDRLGFREIIERACGILSDTVLDAPPPSMAEETAFAKMGELAHPVHQTKQVYVAKHSPASIPSTKRQRESKTV
eukprot:GFKZ01007407.1.p1 GENE.GFKZ01007407.1~~GFKZ01007407.1.p1  ORF type:complete len:442 (+),score=46.72 GFKZ01007407.1:105-1430(+)